LGTETSCNGLAQFTNNPIKTLKSQLKKLLRQIDKAQWFSGGLLISIRLVVSFVSSEGEGVFCCREEAIF
jgi:hypothetical protein